MKAVILVAGASRRLYPLTWHRPKCLLEVGGKAILDWQLEALDRAGVHEVCLVVGYQREQVLEHVHHRWPALRLTTRTNQHFFETNTGHSLWLAGDEFCDRDFLYLNGDVLFDPRVVDRLVATTTPTALALERKPCGDEEVKLRLDADGLVREIGKHVDPATAAGEFIGIARFSAPFTVPFFEQLDRLEHAGERNVYFEAALDPLARSQGLNIVEVGDLGCIEIDFPDDYEAARHRVLPRLA